ncbi:AhpA/YtjB family protein [Marinomonas sp. 15G1-11]|uniref:AhpA/YtjB family protein n=1 Tax=Marinomonas phaeophyticola TaxID=3004091 RepID=A0ABT4JTK7_9GAMM|nr:AhpA/YtjB family protein [Marinomonas sp. 15G1-11]MCZ2721735.1 AhpA/YtjB family protein [Marinomonas sp. 15G1-11]
METTKTSQRFLYFCRRHLSATMMMIITFASLVVLTVVLFWYALTNALDSYLSQQTEVLGSSLATQAAFNATQSILNNDLLSLNVLLTRLVIDDNIISARVFNKQDELLAEANSGNVKGFVQGTEIRPDEAQLVYSSSVKFRNEVVGHVLITLDRTSSQKTLADIKKLLISIAIFICALAVCIIFFFSRWLFAPINKITDVLEALSHKHKDAHIPTTFYLEAFQLAEATKSAQSTDWQKEDDETAQADIPQYEIDFDEILHEQSQRSCALFFEIRNLEEWHENMQPLQVANLLTPIYRALFQASESFLGQVHQYEGHSAIIFYTAQNSGNNLYTNAVCTAEVFLGVVKELLKTDMYENTPTIHFHISLHQGNPHVNEIIQDNAFYADRIQPLIHQMMEFKRSESIDSLLLSEEIFTLPDIQNKVFSGLPEILGEGEEETMVYTVKGISEKLNLKIRPNIESINTTHQQENATLNNEDPDEDYLNITASR